MVHTSFIVCIADGILTRDDQTLLYDVKNAVTFHKVIR